MGRQSLRIVRRWSLILAVAAMVGPARAQAPGAIVTEGRICAVLTDRTGTRLEVTNVGGVANLICHGRLVSCEQGFTVCVNNTFGVMGDSVNRLASLTPPVPFTPSGWNLLPSVTGGPFHLCEPFYQSISDDGNTPKVSTTFLAQTGTETFFQFTGEPYTASVYNLDDQNPPIPLGTLILVLTDNKPTGGKCVGVRTTIQHRVGTCKLWKVRKFYNTCSASVTITEIKELERPCLGGTFAAQAGPGQSVTAVASDLQGQFITLASAGNTGAKVRAGSLATGPESEVVAFVFCQRTVFPNPTPTFGPTGPLAANRTLALLLDFRPGGLTLKPANQPGSEKLVTFYIDVE